MPADIAGRKMINQMHVDMRRGEWAWMGDVEGVPRLGVAKGKDRAGEFVRWSVDGKSVRNLDVACAVLNGEMTLEDAAKPDFRPSRKISLALQIAEIEREIGLRQSVYPRQVAAGKLHQSAADLQIEKLKAAWATLQWVLANEADVRAFVAAKAEARNQEGKAA
jgi:hypothetical protein